MNFDLNQVDITYFLSGLEADEPSYGCSGDNAKALWVYAYTTGTEAPGDGFTLTFSSANGDALNCEGFLDEVGNGDPADFVLHDTVCNQTSQATCAVTIANPGNDTVYFRITAVSGATVGTVNVQLSDETPDGQTFALALEATIDEQPGFGDIYGTSNLETGEPAHQCSGGNYGPLWIYADAPFPATDLYVYTAAGEEEGEDPINCEVFYDFTGSSGLTELVAGEYICNKDNPMNPFMVDPNGASRIYFRLTSPTAPPSEFIEAGVFVLTSAIY